MFVEFLHKCSFEEFGIWREPEGLAAGRNAEKRAGGTSAGALGAVVFNVSPVLPPRRVEPYLPVELSEGYLCQIHANTITSRLAI